MKNQFFHNAAVNVIAHAELNRIERSDGKATTRWSGADLSGVNLLEPERFTPERLEPERPRRAPQDHN